MCLTIKETDEIKITEKPIIVYKIIEARNWKVFLVDKKTHKIESPFQLFYYKKGGFLPFDSRTKLVSPFMGTEVVFDEEMPKVEITRYENEIEEGYHSYEKIEDAYAQMKPWNMAYPGTHRVYEAVIPAGSEYIKGIFNANKSFSSACFASSRILITSKEMNR